MKKILFSAAFLCVTFLAIGQRQINDPNARVRSVSSFDGIEVTSGIQVILTQGNETSVAVSADESEFRDKIKTEVIDNTLKLYFDADFLEKLKGNKNLRAYVSVPELNRITVSAGASVHFDNELKSSGLLVKANSGGAVKGSLDIDQELNVQQSSGAVVTLNGSASRLVVKGSSGSIFRGYDLAVNSCDASTNSGASIQVTVEKELTAHATSGGFIHYKGNGVITGIRTNSGGSISKKG